MKESSALTELTALMMPTALEAGMAHARPGQLMAAPPPARLRRVEMDLSAKAKNAMTITQSMMIAAQTPAPKIHNKTQRFGTPLTARIITLQSSLQPAQMGLTGQRSQLMS